MASRHAVETTAVAPSHNARVATPATTGRWDRRNFLIIVLAREFRELHRITEDPIQSTVDGIRALQHAQRDIDLWTACAQKLRKLALRETQLQWQPLAGSHCALAEREQQKTREPYFQ